VRGKRTFRVVKGFSGHRASRSGSGRGTEEDIGGFRLVLEGESMKEGLEGKTY